MRLVLATIIAFILSTIIFFIVKFWGLSQQSTVYKHPALENLKKAENIYQFKILTPANAHELTGHKAIYLNITFTLDEVWIVAPSESFQARNKKWDDIKEATLKLNDITDQLKDKLIIFNLIENPAAFEKSFIDYLEKINLNKTENFIFSSPYETPLKTIKEIKPTYLLGTSKPEILKLKAMESLFLLEAATLRADIVIHPLTYYKQPFFTADLITEIKRRHKDFIIGPVNSSEISAALTLKPLALIIE